MSSRCGKTLGGCAEKQYSSEASTSCSTRSKPDKSILETETSCNYIRRLRPRPTKQTDHFQPSVFNQVFHQANTRPIQRKRSLGSLSGSKLELNTNKLDIDSATSSTSKKARRKTLPSVGASREEEQPKIEVVPASNTNRTKKSGSDFNTKFASFLKPLSSDIPCSSGDTDIIKPSEKSSKLSVTGPKKLKLVTRKSQKTNQEKRRIYSKASWTIKTGSCASSHRGSERSKQPCAVAAGSSDQPSRTEDVSNSASSRALMRRSRHTRDAVNQQENDHGDAEGSQTVTPQGAEAGATSSNAVVTLSNNDSESEDPDVTRLQALLEARGLPPHFLGNLGPRMQQILHRSMGSGVSSKAHQYLQGMQAVGDESRQLQAAIGMCQLLVMGNEDTLAGFPVKSTVPALVNLLRMEHNFDLMNHACRALTYMMEALPRSSIVIVDAVPVLLEKLQVIQCMDVAEQSLTALDMLSKRHAPEILAAGGQSSCLLYIDFFSLPAQRSALSVAANCCSAIGGLSPDVSSPKEDFHRLVKSSLPLLSGRLTHHDKKCVESVCLCFVRLVDNYQRDPKILSEIAENDLLKNFQQLLVVVPPLLSSNTFVMVLRSMTTLCRNVRALAVALIKDNIAETLSYLLCGTPSKGRGERVELQLRSSQELFEITSLIAQLLPRLPKDDVLFTINSLLWKDSIFDLSDDLQTNSVSWQWKDGTGQWRPYNRHDIRILEAAYVSGEHEANLNTLDSSYTVDFEMMQQINEETGTARAVQRVPARLSNSPRTHSSKRDIEKIKIDDGSKEVECDTDEFAGYVKILLTILYEVYCSSAGSPAVRHSCLIGMQRMVCFSNCDLLKEVLLEVSMSSQISSMLSSSDIKVIVSALQLAEMLMQKLPDVYRGLFQREGVVHQVQQLTESSNPSEVTPSTLGGAGAAPKSVAGNEAAKKLLPSTTKGASNIVENEQISPPLTKAKAFAAAMSGRDGNQSTGAKKKSVTRSSRTTKSAASSFLSNLNPAKWGKSLSSALSHDSSSSTEGASSDSRSHVHQAISKNSLGRFDGSTSRTNTSIENNTEQIQAWIKNQSLKFLGHFKKPENDKSQEVSVLDELTAIGEGLSGSMKSALDSLHKLRDIINTVDVSPFELQHSGLVTSVLRYLTWDAKKSKSTTDPQTKPSELSGKYDEVHTRIRTFLSVFSGLEVEPLMSAGNSFKQITADQTEPMLNMVRKLNQCVGQLEQFQVKSRDLMSGSSQILHVLTTRQLKCQLQRHPKCRNIKQWLGGPVKVDPLVQVHAIERYLITRGYGMRPSNASLSEPIKHLDVSALHEEEDSDDDLQDTVEEFELDDDGHDFMEAESRLSSAASNEASSSTNTFRDMAAGRLRKQSDSLAHKLEFYIGDHKIPHHITVYQALQQFGSSNNDMLDDERDTTFRVLEKDSFWNKTHLIYYKPTGDKEETPSTGEGSGKGKSSRKSRGSKQGRATSKTNTPDLLWTGGKIPQIMNPLHKFLNNELPSEFVTTDPCKEVLCLLRVIHAITRYWYHLYSPNVVFTNLPLVHSLEFVNFKVNAKCVHQLQDPLVIITGQLSTWVQEIGTICSFLLSFEARQLLFKLTTLGRDRAMQHLLDTGAAQEFSTALNMASHSSENHSHRLSRFMPRIEKKKCSVSRKNLLQQAEKIITDHGHSRAIIEIDYEGEVGTGLGPTLEFFTLTSRELQYCGLGIWREELEAGEERPTSDDEEITRENDSVTAAKFVKSATSTLFPKPLSRSAKHNHITRIKTKYRFLGKFLAKALMDGRLLDLPLSVSCYKWLLGNEHSFTALDLQYVDPDFASTHGKLRSVAHVRELLCISDPEKLDDLSMDGCPIEDLGFDMRLPGYPNIELMKTGKSIIVAPQNFDQYLDLITHWTLYEGVRHQMEAMKEGFQSVLSLSSLCYFFPEELDLLFCGSRYQPWNIQELSEACHPDHGYTQDSATIKSLYKILSSYNSTEQQNFLQFVTGCPHLPVGGLRVLNPRLTVVRKTCEDSNNTDNYLPSVMTCLNYLKLPEYSNEDIMRKKLQLAAKEGQKSFLLS